MYHIYRIISIGVLLMSHLHAQTPMISNQGALISLKDGGFVSVHGDVLNSLDGNFHNEDTIHLYGNWENNASNEAFSSLGDGVVRLRAGNQEIKGSSITRFFELHLENSGIKYAIDTDVYVDGRLFLNDREFDVDSNTVHVFNEDLNAVQTGWNGNWGFVSSLMEGGLLRAMSENDSYLFPVGSSIGTTRFRPVNIRPSTNNNVVFKVRFANTDPDNEGYPRSQRAFEICEINPLYYHRISRVQGSEAAQLEFFYDAGSDGQYSDLGKWAGQAWQEASLLNAAAQQFGLDALQTTINISDYSPNPFALTNVSPEITLQADQNPICSNDSLLLTAAGNYPTFNFFVDTTWLQSSAANSFETSMIPGFHPVWVQGTNGICGRYSDTLLIETFLSPVAQSGPDTIIVEGSSANLYASGGDFYNWSPANDLDCAICPLSMANPTQSTYYVVEVESLDGCTSTDTTFVEVKADVGQVLFIPNVITPNNDGKNDTWRIENIQLFPSNRVRIVNRWGDVVHKSEFYDNSWDGSYSGGLLPAGTYYYILDLGDGWGIFKGPVTIIRK